jgi:signal transduction histidine kinase
MNDTATLLINLTHDMKSYLSVIDAIISNLKNTNLTDEQQSLLNLLNHTKNSMCSMVNNTLSFSKLENTQLILKISEFDINELLNITYSMLLYTASNNNVKIIKEFNHNIKNVKGDKTRFQQILMNILSNAVKFTSNGVIKIKTSSKISNNNIIFYCEISDTGIGIEEYKLNTIFNKNTTYDPVDGTGLGLYITKELIKLMDGEIIVISEINKGTTFKFNVKFELI